MLPIERWCFYAQRFEQREVHTWWFCQKGGGVFILYVLDIGGASDGHVVLLTERWCCFVRRSTLHRDDVHFFREGVRV